MLKKICGKFTKKLTRATMRESFSQFSPNFFKLASVWLRPLLSARELITWFAAPVQTEIWNFKKRPRYKLRIWSPRYTSVFKLKVMPSLRLKIALSTTWPKIWNKYDLTKYWLLSGSSAIKSTKLLLLLLWNHFFGYKNTRFCVCFLWKWPLS